MVPKYIKLKWLSERSFVIEHQTGRVNKFGKDGDTFLASNNVLLYSTVYPAIYRNNHPSEEYVLAVAMHGQDRGRDDDVLFVNGDIEKKMIIDAIDEYNKYFCAIDVQLDKNLFKI